jgi:hypothetical protein
MSWCEKQIIGISHVSVMHARSGKLTASPTST